MSMMPMLFIGHGSPMNAIEDNNFTRSWREMIKEVPRPKAIISISAHWFTEGTRIMSEEHPKMVYDMYGFPKSLYEVVYDAPGNSKLAEEVKDRITRECFYDNSWGFDHGTWAVLTHLYPKKDIPVMQISVDATAPPEAHYQIGRELKSLREQGILLLGSGDIVHNLQRVDVGMQYRGFDWAVQFDDYIRDNILSSNHDAVISYQKLGETAELAVPMPDHFNPILYILGASDQNDNISVYNNSYFAGSVSMTSYLFH